MLVERRARRAALSSRNTTLSLAEELQAAVTAASDSAHHHHQPHQQQRRTAVPLGAGGGGGIAQFLVDVAELGSPDQVDPVNKFRDVVQDLAYGCVVDHHHDDCTKSCCDEQLLRYVRNGTEMACYVLVCR